MHFERRRSVILSQKSGGTMFKRRLGRSNLEVSALGLGCWAIGGRWDWLEADGSKSPNGLGKVDDAESIRAIHYALDAGINFFDTAANYGCGHSERILTQAIAGRSEERRVGKECRSQWSA